MRRINEIAFHRYVFSFVEFPSSLFFFFFLESINPFITKEGSGNSVRSKENITDSFLLLVRHTNPRIRERRKGTRDHRLTRRNVISRSHGKTVYLSPKFSFQPSFLLKKKKISFHFQNVQIRRRKKKKKRRKWRKSSPLERSCKERKKNPKLTRRG